MLDPPRNESGSRPMPDRLSIKGTERNRAAQVRDDPIAGSCALAPGPCLGIVYKLFKKRVLTFLALCGIVCLALREMEC